MDGFQFNAEALSNLMGERDADGAAKLEKFGGHQGLLKSLQSSLERGISSSVNIYHYHHHTVSFVPRETKKIW